MSLVKKILNHSFWLLVGHSIGRLAMFLTTFVAARLLSQETFGQFTMIRSTISSIEGILSGALGSSIIKRVSEVSHTDKSRIDFILSTLFATNIIIAALLSISIYFLSPILVEHFFIGQTELVQGLALGSILLVVTTLSNTIQSMLTGFEEYKKLAFSAIGASFLSLPLIVVFIYFYGLYGAVWGVIVYFFSDFVWKYFQLRKKVSFSLTYSFTSMIVEAKKILHVSTPLFLSVTITSVSFWYARVMIINRTDSFIEIAIFDAAYQWLTIIMIITGATTSVALPIFSRHFANKESNTEGIFRIHLVVNFFIALIFALVFILFSREIMSLYGKSYSEGYEVLNLLAINAIFFTLAAVYNRFMIARGNTRSIAYAAFIGIICMFIVLKMTFLHGAQNLALSMIAYYFTNTIYFIIVKFFLEKKKHD